MHCHRRQFFAQLATLPVAMGIYGYAPKVRAESLSLNWPSVVLQVPPEHKDDTPPVVTAIAVHPQGRIVATAGDDHVVYLWDMAQGRLMHRLRAHADWVHTLSFSPFGDVLLSAGTDSRVIFWDTNSGGVNPVVDQHDHPISRIAFSNGGEYFAETGFEDHLRIYDANTRTLLREMKTPCNDMRVVSYSPDDTLLAAGGRDGVVRVWRSSDGEHVTDYRVHGHRIRGLEFSPDGKFLVTSGEDRRIHVRSLAAMGEGFNLPNSAAKVLSLHFFGAQELATGCSDNVIRLWDLSSRSETGKLRGHTGSVTTLASFGRKLVSGSYDATIRVWSISDNVAGIPPRPLLPLRTSRKPE